MEDKRAVQNFCGHKLLTWDNWDEVGENIITLYDIEFEFDSMKKFNGLAVDISLDGSLIIWDEDGIKELWKGYPTDIPEFRELLKL